MKTSLNMKKTDIRKNRSYKTLSNKDFKTIRTKTQDNRLISFYAVKQSNTKHGEKYLLVGSKEEILHGDTILFQFYSNNFTSAKFNQKNYTEGNWKHLCLRYRNRFTSINNG